MVKKRLKYKQEQASGFFVPCIKNFTDYNIILNCKQNPFNHETKVAMRFDPDCVLQLNIVFPKAYIYQGSLS